MDLRSIVVNRTHIMRRSFTLIEVLVVIAIIAILAAMLLPALNSARMKAYGANCSGNLKQQGTAIAMYVDSNDGFFPVDNLASGQKNGYGFAHWRWQIAPYLGITVEDQSGNSAEANKQVELARGPFACPAFRPVDPAALASLPLFGGGYGWNGYNNNSAGVPCGMGYVGVYVKSSRVTMPGETITSGDASNGNNGNARQHAFLYWPAYVDSIGLGTRHSDKMQVCMADGHVIGLNRTELSRRALSSTGYYHYYFSWK